LVGTRTRGRCAALRCCRSIDRRFLRGESDELLWNLEVERKERLRNPPLRTQSALPPGLAVLTHGVHALQHGRNVLCHVVFYCAEWWRRHAADA
jgi:hypothetical protein